MLRFSDIVYTHRLTTTNSIGSTYYIESMSLLRETLYTIHCSYTELPTHSAVCEGHEEMFGEHSLGQNGFKFTEMGGEAVTKTIGWGVGELRHVVTVVSESALTAVDLWQRMARVQVPVRLRPQ